MSLFFVRTCVFACIWHCLCPQDVLCTYVSTRVCLLVFATAFVHKIYYARMYLQSAPSRSFFFLARSRLRLVALALLTVACSSASSALFFASTAFNAAAAASARSLLLYAVFGVPTSTAFNAAAAASARSLLLCAVFGVPKGGSVSISESYSSSPSSEEVGS